MRIFKKTTHLSEILEKSESAPTTILKYSDDCGSSSRLADQIGKALGENDNIPPIYMVTIQTEPNLSKKIEEWFNIKHETPQVIHIYKGKVLYTDHHNNIKIDKFIGK